MKPTEQLSEQPIGISIRGSVLSAIRKQGIATLAAIKTAVFLGDVPVKIALIALQNEEIIEHGYLTTDGAWLDDWSPDEHQDFPINAYRICK